MLLAVDIGDAADSTDRHVPCRDYQLPLAPPPPDVPPPESEDEDEDDEESLPLSDQLLEELSLPPMTQSPGLPTGALAGEPVRRVRHQ